MNLVFFGTSSFATSSLMALISGKDEILAVVTQPDRRSGRGLMQTFSPVKLVAQKCNLQVHQPASTGSADFLKILSGLKPDLFVVAAFGQILPKAVLEIPGLYSINVHSSLLPKYRGAAPINRAILNGDNVTGVTIFRMTEGTDEGDVIAQKEVAIEDTDTALTLNDKLSKAGADLLISTLALISSSKATFTEQDSAAVTFAPKLTKKDGLISWAEKSVRIHNHVRAMVPWPAAYTSMHRKQIKVLKTRILRNGPQHDHEPGTIVGLDREGITVKTGDGAILICELQAEGGKKLSADAYCRGHKLEINQKFA